jgi:hypothetical protein
MKGWVVAQDSTAIGVAEDLFGSGEEEKFRGLIEAHPEVIPISEINPTATVAIPIGREVTIPSVGSVDLLFLDDTGRLVVIECKLIQNPEARREVIAQLLEYGSRVRRAWNDQKVSAIADAYGQKHGRTSLCAALNEARARVVGERVDIAPLTPSSLSQKIRDGLRSEAKGPILVVAGNRLEQRALVLSDYLRQRRVPIACVEVQGFRINGTQFLIGAVRAASLVATLSPSQGAALSRDEWIEMVEDGPVKCIRRDLLEWAEGLEKQGLCSLRFGTVDLLIDVKGNEDQSLILFDIGRETFITYFDTMRRFGASDEDVQDVRNKIKAIVGPDRLGPGTQYASFRLVDLEWLDACNRMKELLTTRIKTIAVTSTAG